MEEKLFDFEESVIKQILSMEIKNPEHSPLNEQIKQLYDPLVKTLRNFIGENRTINLNDLYNKYIFDYEESGHYTTPPYSCQILPIEIFDCVVKNSNQATSMTQNIFEKKLNHINNYDDSEVYDYIRNDNFEIDYISLYAFKIILSYTWIATLKDKSFEMIGTSYMFSFKYPLPQEIIHMIIGDMKEENKNV